MDALNGRRRGRAGRSTLLPVGSPGAGQAGRTLLDDPVFQTPNLPTRAPVPDYPWFGGLVVVVMTDFYRWILETRQGVRLNNSIHHAFTPHAETTRISF